MAKPQEWQWNPQSRRFESKGQDGLVKGYVNATGLGADQLTAGTLATIQATKIGGGAQINKVHKFVGTNLALTAVGTGAVAIATMLGAVCAVGDSVFASPKADVSARHVGLAGLRVPTTNVINMLLQNSKPDSAGSYPGTGWDVTVVSNA